MQLRNGPHTGIHISSAVVTTITWSEVVQAPGSTTSTDAFTTPGMWVTITARLNSSPATTGLQNQLRTA